uniref:Uncharacterized protein n=1 Tax=Anguilla anguilla TaxID=7936 RepID=A0A0E9URW0_ANGAN
MMARTLSPSRGVPPHPSSLSWTSPTGKDRRCAVVLCTKDVSVR